MSHHRPILTTSERGCYWLGRDPACVHISSSSLKEEKKQNNPPSGTVVFFFFFFAILAKRESVAEQTRYSLANMMGRGSGGLLGALLPISEECLLWTLEQSSQVARPKRVRVIPKTTTGTVHRGGRERTKFGTVRRTTNRRRVQVLGRTNSSSTWANHFLFQFPFLEHKTAGGTGESIYATSDQQLRQNSNVCQNDRQNLAR